MMDWKVDWATETASKLMHGVAKLGDKSVGGIFEVSEIATALRKAKAEGYALGLKESGEIMLENMKRIIAGGEPDTMEELLSKATSRASEIENPTP